jgi:hypothetical protein
MLVKKSIGLFAYTRHTPHPLHEAVAHFLVRAGFELLIPNAIDYSSVLRLENMMRDSDCFVAIESSIDKDDVSPDISALLFQSKLASRANKPIVLLIDHLFRQYRSFFTGLDHEMLMFDREQGLDNFLKGSLGDTMASIRYRIQRPSILPPRRDVVLLVDSVRDIHTVYSDSVVSTLRRVFADRRYMVNVIDLGLAQDAWLYNYITDFAFVVIDGRSSLFSPQIAEGISARFVPIVRLCHIKDGESVETVSSRELSSAAAGYELEINGRKIRPVTYWENESQLEVALNAVLTTIKLPRTETLKTHADVTAHFGRTDSLLQFRVLETPNAPPKVFLSNSGSTRNSLINQIFARLRSEKIEFFHYQKEDDISLGDNWQRTLEVELRRCSVFVAVINHDYFASTWCLFEMKLALDLRDQEKIKVFSYYLNKEASASDLQLQSKLDPIQNSPAFSMSDVEIADDIIRNYKRVNEIYY